MFQNNKVLQQSGALWCNSYGICFITHGTKCLGFPCRWFCLFFIVVTATMDLADDQTQSHDLVPRVKPASKRRWERWREREQPACEHGKWTWRRIRFELATQLNGQSRIKGEMERKNWNFAPSRMSTINDNNMSVWSQYSKDLLWLVATLKKFCNKKLFWEVQSLGGGGECCIAILSHVWPAADVCKKLFLNKNELMSLKNKPCGQQVNLVFKKPLIGVGKSTVKGGG